MAKKKAEAEAEANGSAVTSESQTAKTKTSKGKQPEAPAGLTISRNKHTRFISAFHGPWLQLPHEILGTLAHSNYLSPRPRQTDPAVLYDLIKIRKLVDDASDLAVRAANGTASSALGSSDNGLPGGALGLSYRGGGNAKLSPERKYRMRELAVQKLSQAYRLDEIAASVATMQGASALDNVASFVLQRNPNSIDARYVHFFHEKIPSRMMSESTPLTTLNDLIAAEPGHAAPYRTRALTRIFKEDFAGAAHDLTDALTLCRLEAAKHKAGRNQLVTMQTVREEAAKRRQWTRDWMQKNKVLDDDQPKGIEMQLLFQRGNQYLTLACRCIRTALEGFRAAKRGCDEALRVPDAVPEQVQKESNASEAYKRAVAAREDIRKFAKRALRDYTVFFAKLDYAHARRHVANGDIFGHDPIIEELDDFDPPSGRRANDSNGTASKALVHRSKAESSPRRPEASPPPPLKIHPISDLLSTSPPADLPPFPTFDGTDDYDDETITYHPLLPETLHSFLLTHCLLQTDATTLQRHAHNVARLVRLADGYPFFLAARSPSRADWAEILRKTQNFVGLSSSWEQLCKITTPPSSTSQTSQSRMTSSPVPAGRASKTASPQRTDSSKPDKIATLPETQADGESSDQKRDRIHKEAVMDALGDERVVDDDTFHRAVEAREKRAWKDSIEEALPSSTPDEASPSVNGSHGPTNKPSANGTNSSTPAPSTPETPPSAPVKRAGADKHRAKIAYRDKAIAKDEEYLIGTERAEAIAFWIQQAPTTVDTSSVSGKKRKGARRKKKGGPAAEDGVEHANANGHDDGEAEELDD